MLFPFPSGSTARKRVVITGAGVVTSLGIGWKANESGFRTGRTAFDPVNLFDVSRQRVKVAAQVSLPDSLPANAGISSRQSARLDRAARLLLLAADEAWQQSGWENHGEIPLVLGTTSGGMALGERFYQQAIQPPHSRRQQATRVAHYQVQQQALDLTAAFNFEGPITIVANACASGSNAIGHAYDLVARGAASRVFTGGYDGLCQLVFSGFDSLQALSPTQCRPFSQSRDGLALGEGAAMLTVESLDSARHRHAEILAEIVGYGASTDAHHLTQPHPQGDAALASMQAATQVAQIAPEKIGYINAHGTGTPLNDSAEAAAINRWAGPASGSLAVSSTKASVGHLLGAAGAVEAVVCLMALRGQWIPPMPGVVDPDPVCQFKLVQEPEEKKFDYALSNSFGFGGANATLILRRWT